MARNRWSIRNYNTFIREARSRGAGLDEARSLYRNMRGALGRGVYGSDLKNHPRIAAREFRRVVEPQWFDPKRRTERDPGEGPRPKPRRIPQDEIDFFYESWEDMQDIGDEEGDHYGLGEN